MRVDVYGMKDEHGWPVEMMMLLLLVVAVLGLRLCGSQKKEFGDGNVAVPAPVSSLLPPQDLGPRPR